jgi:hypothetical protein
MMKRVSPIAVGCLFFFLVPCAFAGESLDKLYGTLEKPTYIKYYEIDKAEKVLLNPYLQIASAQHPGILHSRRSPYNWVIDAKGRVGIIQEADHPYGRTYAKGYVRPEDNSKRKPGTSEKYGHISAVAGAPSRIGGEILFDKRTRSWVINNKSGRYSLGNVDRTPEQLTNAAKLIQVVIDPGEVPWGSVVFLLKYAPKNVADELQKGPDVKYDDVATKSNPYVLVDPLPDNATLVGQAAANDDPS